MQAIPLQTVGRRSIPFKYGYVDARLLQTLCKAETACASPNNHCWSLALDSYFLDSFICLNGATPTFLAKIARSHPDLRALKALQGGTSSSIVQEDIGGSSSLLSELVGDL